MGDLRLAELMAALSLATDLGMGQPLEQAVRTCLVAVRLGERMGLSGDELSEVYYVALLRFLGCTADAHEAAQMAGGDEIGLRAAIAPVLGGGSRAFAAHVMPSVGAGQGPLRRVRLVAGMMARGREQARRGLVAHCEVAESLALRLGLLPGVRAGLASAFEQWNGRGLPKGLSGEAIPLPARIVFLARDVDVLAREGDAESVVAAVRTRRGAAYDPAVAEAFLRDPMAIISGLEVGSAWDDMLRSEPEPWPWVPETRLDDVLTAFADFIDLKSPFLAGHSRAVAALVGDAPAEVRRAALVHDLGRVAVPNGIWDKPGPLGEGERERVRTHTYYTERIVGRVTALKPLAMVAAMHHERLDGSGYHRGCARGELTAGARLLAAADTYQAMTSARPHRPALSGAQAAEELRAMATSGVLDGDAVDAVLVTAGHAAARAPRLWPAGLSDREVQVLRLICRGATKKQAAATLSISPRTVDHHVRHIYDKVGVQSRAGVTVFAMANGLLNSPS